MIVTEKSAMRTGFAKEVRAIAQTDPSVILLGCDVTRSLFLDSFAEELPEQYLSIGIAEQNAAGIAAGLALCGKKPVFATYAAFATTRALDQIRMSICYNNAGVFIAGAHAGLSVGPDGGSHQSLEDIAVMRSLPGMTVVLPCDANETAAATMYYLEGEMDSPVYMRFGRNEVPNFTAPEKEFKAGAELLHKGDGSFFIVTHGAMVWNCLEVVERLEAQGVHPSLIQIRTLGDGLADAVIRESHSAQSVLVVEEHQVQGGVGEYVARILGANDSMSPLSNITCIGVNSVFGQSGTPEELYQLHGLSADKIFTTALHLASNRS